MIAVLRKNDTRLLEQSINKILKRLIDSLNAKTKVDEWQALDIIKTIIQEYGDVTFEELVYTFNQAAMGRYGKDFNRIDKMTICTWIDTFKNGDERLTMLETRHKKSAHQQYVAPAPMTEQEQARFDQLQNVIKTVQDKGKMKEPVKFDLPWLHSDREFLSALTELAVDMDEREINELIKSYSKKNFKEGIAVLEAELKIRKK